MDEDLPAVLLVGGGEGMGPVEATARALGQSLYDANTGKVIGQLVVVCGRNKRLVKKLEAMNWNIPVKVWVPNAQIFCTFGHHHVMWMFFPHIVNKYINLRSVLHSWLWCCHYHVQINGFVTNMSEWMAASDCIITKVVSTRFLPFKCLKISSRPEISWF